MCKQICGNCSAECNKTMTMKSIIVNTFQQAGCQVPVELTLTDLNGAPPVAWEDYLVLSHAVSPYCDDVEFQHRYTPTRAELCESCQDDASDKYVAELKCKAMAEVTA